MIYTCGAFAVEVKVCVLNKVFGFDLRRSCTLLFCTWTYKLSNVDFRLGIESQKHLCQYYYYTMLINEIGFLDFFCFGSVKMSENWPVRKKSRKVGVKMSENSRGESIPKCLRKIRNLKILKSSSKSACPV